MKIFLLISALVIVIVLSVLSLPAMIPYVKNRFDGPDGLVFAKSPDRQSYIVCGFEGDRSVTDIVIPDTFKNKPVTGIGNSKPSSASNGATMEEYTEDPVFRDCSNLTSITLPDTLEYIGVGAFYGSNLTSITIPDSVTSIGDGAFDNCFNLTSLTLPKKLKNIGDNAFSGCLNLTGLTIPGEVESIGYYAFSYCESLTSITVPDSVTSIGEYAFTNCKSLTSLTIPDSVELIGRLYFYGCENLTSVTIPESVRSSVTVIDSYAFKGCQTLTHITIPDGITEIGDYAFAGCSNLTSVTIPGSVKRIAHGAFYNSHLTTIYYGGTHDDWENIEIGDFIGLAYPYLETLYCADGVYNF